VGRRWNCAPSRYLTPFMEISTRRGEALLPDMWCGGGKGDLDPEGILLGFSSCD